MRAHIMYVGVLADAGYEKIHADFANKRYIVQIDKRVTTLVSYTFYRFSTMDSRRRSGAELRSSVYQLKIYSR